MIRSTQPLTKLIATYPHLTLPSTSLPFKRPLFIDIETTGLSSRSGYIYAIGCIYQQDGDWLFSQWLIEDFSEEKQLLIQFLQLITDSQIEWLVHYNGKSFDIPFIQKRLSRYKLTTSLASLQQFDFFHELKYLKPYLNLPNYKLKSVEKVFSFNRQDPFTGHDLTYLFDAFVLGQRDLAPVLLRHNADDLIALYLLNHFNHWLVAPTYQNQLFPLSPYLPEGDHHWSNYTSSTGYHLQCRSQLLYQKVTTLFAPKKLSVNSNQLHSRQYSVIKDRLSYFFKDYHNYDYLVAEQVAVHHSIGQFVDRQYRQKATRQTARVEKTGFFVEIPLSSRHQSLLLNDYPEFKFFRRSYQSNQVFLTLDDFRQLASTTLNLNPSSIVFF